MCQLLYCANVAKVAMCTNQIVLQKADSQLDKLYRSARTCDTVIVASQHCCFMSLSGKIRSYWHSARTCNIVIVASQHSCFMSLSGQIRSYWHRDMLRASLSHCDMEYFQCSFNR